jgi:hypothetical protein
MTKSMTNRQRILAILDRRSPDRIPWIPRLELWYTAHKLRGDLPEKYQDWSLRQIERDLGMGTPAREGRVYRLQAHGVEVRSETRGEETVTEYHTPQGMVFTTSRYSTTLHRGGIAAAMQVGHLIRGPEDYAPVEWIIEHTEVLPAYDDYLAYDAEIGEDGLPMVYAAQEPMYHILQDLVGYNNAFFHLADYRPQVMHLYQLLMEQARQIQSIVLDSPARLILHGEHFDSQMTPPPFFQEYMLAYFQDYAERLHARGKSLVCHGDADTSLLLSLIKEAGFDMSECFVTAPMVKVTLAEARRAWGSQVAIWGGIPSVLLCDPVTDEEFHRYLRELFRTIAPGDGFILGVADNVMAEARFERIKLVSEMVEQFGDYPIDAGRL